MNIHRSQNNLLKRTAKLEKELAAKSHELEIEAALEKVRGRSMAMRQSEDLSDVSDVLFHELKQLGINTTRSGFAIYNEQEEKINLWLTNRSKKKNVTRVTGSIPMGTHPVTYEKYIAWKKKKKFSLHKLKGREVSNYYRALSKFLSLPLQKVYPASLNFYTFFFDQGSLNLLTEELVSQEEFKILIRFAKVFGGTYTRFLDLQKAEAQARQAQIELGLERLRNRAMAMHQTSELQEVIHVVHKELLNLSVSIDGGSFVVINDDVGEELRCWGSGGTANTSEEVRVPHFDMPFCTDLMKAIKKGPGFFTEEFSQKEKKKYFTKLFQHKPWSDLNTTQKKQTLSSPGGYTRSVAVSKHTSVFIINHQGRTFTEDENDILKRFAKVFEQTYTRFLDLKNAEAQAREAQIEAALERVRSRAMAMQTSEELNALIGTVFTELTKLDLVLTRCVILIYEDDGKGVRWWMANSEAPSMPMDFFVKYADMPFFNEYLKGWQERSLKWQYILEGENKFNTDEFLFKETKLSQLPDFVIAGMRAPDRVYLNASFNNFGNLTLASLEPLSDEHFDILLRFARVFDLTYTRFNDLQKAEAQAREAQIELGLERVRARAMAMQNSNELSELVAILFDELVKLDLVLARCIIWIFDNETLSAKVWMANSEDKKTADSYYIKRLDHPYYDAIIKEWKERNPKWVYELSGENKRSIDNLLLNETELSKLSAAVKKGIKSSKHTSISGSFNNFGFIEASGPVTHSEEQLDVLSRFGKVFDLSYTRFSDLKQAEAQAREAQIELGLERVRARAMAMQRSEELKELIVTVSRELSKLDIVLDRCFIITYDTQTHDSTWWMANPETPAEPIGLLVKYHEYAPYLAHIEAWKERKIKFEYILEGQVKKKWDHFLFSETELSQLPQVVIENMRSKEKVYLSSSFNNFGYLQLATLEPLTDEQFDIMLRFARVFDLTYTRFNDLKQAETQARESQIQLALERVRARTMAMQKSNELAEAAHVLYEEFKTLNINTFTCGYLFIKEEQHKQTAWVTTPDGILLPDFIDFPLTGDHVLDKRYKDWKQKKPLHIFEIQGEANKEHHRYLASKVPDHVANEIFAQIPDRIIFYCANFSAGYLFIIATEFLSSEEEEIIVRFAKVFELTYTRFSDLKQAETQAREAQIQLALERVRASTMAMHRSEDLAGTAQILFHQLQELGEIPDRMSIGIPDEAADVVNFWSTDQLGSHINNSFKARLNERTVISKTYQAWKDHKKSLVIDLHGEELKEWLQFAREEMNIAVKDEFIKDRRVHNLAFFTHGWLLVTTHEIQPAEVIQILERFASVFNLTYRRFLDLQKAEAQAREAQIEAALERVRSRSMAMHQSSDLHEVIKVVTEQLLGLGIKFNVSNFARIDAEGSWDLWISTPEQAYPALVHVPYLDHGLFNKLIEVIGRGGDFLADAYDQEEKNMFFKHFFENTLAKYTPGARKEWVMSCKGFARSVFLTKNIWLAVSNYDGVPFGNEDNAIFKRFANAFEQTYTRFLDLQKAEANAREAQIEASLERVRSKTMAMHNSNDVGETVATMFAEFILLDIHTNRCGILIFNDEHTAEVWTARSTQGGNAKLVVGRLDLDAHKMLRSVHNAWKTKDASYQYDLLGDDLVLYYTAINNSKFYPTQFDLQALPSKEFHSDFFFADGAVFSFTNEPIPEQQAKIMKRFAGVFGQTYRRYLDLQKAEAQAREAQIEAALERVRAKAMAMHNSQDLAETIRVFYQQLDSLKLMPRRCGVGLLHKDTHIAELMGMVINEQGETKEMAGKLTLQNHPVLENVYNSWIRQEEYYPVLRGAEIKEYYALVASQIPVQNYPDDAVQFGYFFSFPEGQVYAWTDKEFIEDELKIYRRFTSVLSLTYKRYKDLKQAEAQAKEAQIEAGLERVRARTMAMHSSEDVSAATATMFVELEKLGVENIRGGITNILSNRTQDVWSVTNLAEGKVLRAVGAFNVDAHPFWQLMFKEWEEKRDFTHYFLAGREKEEYIKILNATQGYLTQAIQQLPDVHFQVYYFNEGGVWTNSLQAHSEEDKQVMKRFTSVFSLTFRRYQDLKKAEAQAREATIEAALEKVRGKAMAMHNSNDLSATASMVFTELRKLGINPIRCGVGLLNKESRKAQLFSATSSADGDSLALVGWVILSEHPVLEKIYDTWLNNEEYYPELQGEQMRLYYEQLLKGLPVTAPTIEADKKQYGHFIPFSVGCLYAWSATAYDESEIRILKRFATIIDLTFRRYIELQQSEANAREAVKQAALDRIRADIASMRTVGDLDKITPLIWNELTILGLPFIRCGVFIMDNSEQLIHTFLSTPEGNAIAAFHLPYSTPGNIQKVISHWQDEKKYIDHWDEADFSQFAEILVRENALASADAYLKTIPHGGFYLHFLPFLQGMLYVGNTTQLNDENIQLIQAVADAFSTAYARYEDFNRLEAAKQQVEKTLTDLKQAQTQLVQSEKMASLGELTAGIAHEIQNPLNFVNNFSDVSNELLDEMKVELAKGNINDAIAIAEDVKQNLEKINHHGKRADGIVKGMLQHSRTSSGQKELTDINALADEYLRLAFHGLRAKDKSFNAKFETDFDSNVGKINIISQDIGRVILNLINNAFYAVSEKKKQLADAYEPTVTLTTIRENGKVEVKVKDNGNGIPMSIVDKIFQPFFTTKPTGQGTGLGLSLAYDIVKAHGGEIKVETKEGEGSEFIIQLK
jgi:signal transduction histidine kinase/DNA-directed RNA polymerase subunit N (RpoN/RPB10)